MNMRISSKVNELRELQSTSGEELRPLFGRTLILSHRDCRFEACAIPQGRYAVRNDTVNA
jgi:hypothetical protein